MLCNSKIPRPDRVLQNRLILMAYCLGLLLISIVALVVIPEHFLYVFPCILFFVIFLFVLTLRVIKSAENAISYGGFANQIFKNDTKIKRIDNVLGEVVLENLKSNDLFGTFKVLSFLEQHIQKESNNQLALNKLQKAVLNLNSEKVELSLQLDFVEWFEVSIHPLYLKKENIFDGPFSLKKIQKESFVLWSLKNITSQKSLETIFVNEQKYLLDFLDYLPVGIYTTNQLGEIEYANYALASLFEQDKDALFGQKLKDYLAQNSEIPQTQNLWQGRIMLNLANIGIVEAQVFQSSFKKSSEVKSHGVIITGLSSERELRDDLNMYKNIQNSLFDNSPIGIIFSNSLGDITKINSTAQDFLENKNPNLSKAFEIEIKPSIIDLTINKKNFLVYINQTIYKDTFVLYLIDATKQKSLELQFGQAQKMQALGQMAGGISHDFNNLLTAMIGFCDLLISRHGVGDPSFADLIQIKQNANRAAGLVRQLLAFSRKQPLNPKLIDVVDSFSDLSQMLKRLLGEQIKLDIYHDSDLGFVRVDTVQFSQVIINLCINAKDAMSNSGSLSIKTYNYKLDAPYHFGADTINAGEFVAIDVIDTGCGISEENMDKIFDPFFSTKQNVAGSGTGLGLAMVYGIVRQTEGFIKVNSELGVGTTFSIFLPKFANNEEVAEAPQEASSNLVKVQQKIKTPISVNEKMILGLNVSTIDRRVQEISAEISNTRILFVEDEDSVRAFALRALSKKGFEIVGCNSAENALEVLATDKNFQLLITDMVMPGKNGAELAKLVKAQLPNIKIILSSGYSEEIAKDELAGSTEFAFLAKPFSLGDLSKKVLEVLEK